MAAFRPLFAAGIVFLSLAAAALEGIGLSYLLPIIEIVQNGQIDPDTGGVLGLFVAAYNLVGLPITLTTVVLGVAAVMAGRYGSSFLVGWLRAALRATYVGHLQRTASSAALGAEVAYFDRQGSDNIINTIVTQARYAGTVIERITRFIEQAVLSIVYLSVALYLAPILTLGTAVVLGTLTFGLRRRLESAFSLGERVAEANEKVQTSVQAGMQGIRDVKLFGLTDELYEDLSSAVGRAVEAETRLRRNQQALDNFYELLTAWAVFGLVWASLTVVDMSVASLGVFLFAMFRLAPRVSTLNQLVYEIEGDLPHLVRTQDFIEDLEERREPTGGDLVPDKVGSVTVDKVSFTYRDEDPVLDGVSMEIPDGSFVAVAGPSGAGKSTLVALLTRLYAPDEGEIRSDGIPIQRYNVAAWRSRMAVVRQNPYIFNDTLRRNITIAKREATDEEIRRVCETACVTEFLPTLPDSLDTVLGDDGVRLSGGQRQRVAIARALLTDSDLLLLDEATSDLDMALEERIHDRIDDIDGERSLLVIAHRLSSIKEAERIYALEDGRVVEMGTHEELLKADGTYADLYDAQLRRGSAE